MQSSLVLGTSVIPNPVEKFKPENFQVIPLTDVSVQATPEEAEYLLPAREQIKWNIAHAGTYDLSPFCYDIESPFNKVRLANGQIIQWGEAFKRAEAGEEVYIQDSHNTVTKVIQTHRTGVQPVYEYRTDDGTPFHCTETHRFCTYVDGVVTKMPIEEIYQRELPLLIADEWEEQPTHNDHGEPLVYPTDLQPGELLKHIRGYEGLYAISNMGRVWAFNKVVEWEGPKGHSVKHISERWRACYQDDEVNDGYRVVILNGATSPKTFKMSRLVAEYFCNNPDGLKEVNHIDGDRSNDVHTNLERVSRRRNLAHRDSSNRSTVNPGKYKSRFIGLNYLAARPNDKKWQVRISDPLLKKRVLIGYFLEEEEAARAYDAYVIERNLHKTHEVPLNFGFELPELNKNPVYRQVRISSKTYLRDTEVANIGVEHESHTYLVNGSRNCNSMNWNQKSDIYTILALFKEHTHSVALSSCRVDAIAQDPGLAKLITTFGSTNLTAAVEGISERIRNYLNKSLSDEEQYVGINHAISSGFRSIKFYYIYTGKENMEDIIRFQAFLQALEEIKKVQNKPGIKIRFSFTPLLSTLGTPTQYHGASIQRSLKLADRPLMRIRQACTRAGFDVRLSTPIPVSDFSQMIEFTDRRAAPLMEYASLCGLSSTPLPSVHFLQNPVEITKAEFNKTDSDFRFTANGKFYKADHVSRMNFEKLYNHANEAYLHPENNESSLIKLLIDNDGQKIKPQLEAIFHGTWAGIVQGSTVFLQWQEGYDLRHTYKNGAKLFGFVINMSMAQTQADRFRQLMPMFTGGQTFEDSCCDKNAMYVLPGDHVKFHENRHLGWCFKTHVENRAYILSAYCYSANVQKCLVCGACKNAAEVKSVSGDPKSMGWEYGHSHYQLVEQASKPKDPAYKILVEARIETGPFAAMRANWLRHAINRAVLMGSDGELVKGLLYNRFNHSRQHYKHDDGDTKTILAGQFLYQIEFNSHKKITQEYLDSIFERTAKHVTEGWSIESMRLVPLDFAIKNTGQLHYTEYRFDSRRVEGMTLSNLRSKIARFNEKGMKYRRTFKAGRDIVKSEVVEFDNNKIHKIVAKMGDTPTETILRVFADTRENHPMNFLCGFLGEAKPLNPVSVMGTDITVIGTYQNTQGDSDSLLNLAEDDDLSDKCSKCNGPRFLNIVTGQPFGHASYEKTEPAGLCQFCHMDL